MENSSGDYWAYIEPFWDEIEIYSGGDIFLKTYAAVPQPAAEIYAAHFAQSEICNGGFNQLFWNSTGVLSPEAIKGFQRIGMTKTAALLIAAIDTLGPVFPRERKERQECLEGVSKEIFKNLDKKFFMNIDEEQGGFQACADAYVLNLKS